MHCKAEFGDIMMSYPPQQSELQTLLGAPFPRVFPFSAVVPLAYAIIREFIDDSVKFVKDLDLSDTELDEAGKRMACVQQVVHRHDSLLLQHRFQRRAYFCECLIFI